MDFFKLSLMSLTLFFFVACESEKPFVLPIEEEKLVEVLSDVHIAETALKKLKGKTKDSTTNVYYNQIYTIHKLDSTLFKETMEMLRKRPAELQKVYTKVKDKLTVLEKELSNKKKAKKDSTNIKTVLKKIDSLKRIPPQ